MLCIFLSLSLKSGSARGNLVGFFEYKKLPYSLLLSIYENHIPKPNDIHISY
jgi:hypothetical protein